MTREREAEEIKIRANAAFGKKQYQEAIRLYGEAITLHPTAIYYSNRAACYLQLKQWDKALTDTREAVKLDPTYAKGKVRHVEALIRVGCGDEALRYANELYSAEGSTKNHELVENATRCKELSEGSGTLFLDHLNQGALTLARGWLSVAAQISSGTVVLASTEERSKSEAKQDEVDLQWCELIESISTVRDQACAIFSQITSDSKFLRNEMLGYSVDPLLYVYQRLLTKCISDVCDVGVRLGLDGFPGQEVDEKGDRKPLPNYVGNALSELQRIGRSSQPMYCALLASAMLLGEANISDVDSVLMRAGQAPGAGEFQLPQFSRCIKEYISQKDAGSSSFKANKFDTALVRFNSALKAIMDPSTLSSESLSGLAAMIYLALRQSAAAVLSNAGMCLNKLRQNGKALAYLRAAILIDPSYYKAHIRAANIYKEQGMLLECIRECGYAISIDENGSKGCQELAKQCQADAVKYSRPDYYAWLNVPRTIDPTSNEYSSAYRKACLKWHPDRHRDPVKKRFAQIKFRQVQEADSILKDPQKRRIYDSGGNPAAGGAEGAGVPMSMNMGGMGIDIGSIFSSMFGGGMPGGNVRIQFATSSGGRGGPGIDLSQFFSF
ncbi:Chaperone protein DnaJ [Giardia muris]|uniref:Chaperone protein DnaJ n=1 Tax=Giardia muris TaxID=5742 RepID=A0A4Z1TB38_GIAMU|nr:Chaperone protein DnaJ [Giardia muris]|eukprot:TNJ29749.1 Chaperone protein DnaJ [Giardia muris]